VPKKRDGAKLSTFNANPNSTCIGAVAGTPGTLPLGWTVDYTDTGFGLTVACGGRIFEGVPGVQFRVSGTPTTGAAGRIQWVMARFAALAGVQRVNGVNLKIISATGTYTLKQVVNVEDTTASYLSSPVITNRAPTTAALGTQLFTSTYLTPAGTGFVANCLQIAYTVGVALDVTFWIGLPQDEPGTTLHNLVTPGAAMVANDAHFGRPIPPSLFGTHIEGPTMAGTGFPYANGPSPYVSRGRSYSPECRWNNVTNSALGVHDLSGFRAWLNLCATNGIAPYYTLGTGEVPDFAGSATNPDNASWEARTIEIVKAGAGRVKFWEIWNEADSATYWTGTAAQMVSKARFAYNLIKSYDKNAIVIAPSVTGSANGMGWLRDFLLAGGGDYCDWFSFHNYQQTYTPFVPELLYTNALAHLAIIRACYNVPKPVIDSESSPAANANVGSVALRASYLAKTYVLTWSAGIEASYWYALDNAVYSTLYDITNGHNDASTAYRLIRNWLEGATMRGPATASGTFWSCNLVRDGNYQAQIVWDTSGSGSYIVPYGFTQYRDLKGNRYLVTFGQTITIGDSPVIFESSNAVAETPSSYLISPTTLNKTVWNTKRDGALPATANKSMIAVPVIDGLPAWVNSAASLDLDFFNSSAFPRIFDTELVDTRTSTQWVTTQSGALTQKTSGVVPVCDGGLLVEPARTNIALSNGNLTNATYWTPTNATITGGQADPKGGTAAALFNEGTTAGVAHNLIVASTGNYTVSVGTTYTTSVYVKAGTMSIFQMTFGLAAFGAGIGYANFDLTGNSGAGSVVTGGTLVGATITAVGGGWYRCTMSATATAAVATGPVSLCGIPNTSSIRSVTYTGTSRTIYFAFPQCEAGSFPTSLIDTTTATVSRTANAITLQRTGIGRIVFTFDDNSTQTITNIDPTTQYAIPTTLNRRLIKRITGYPVVNGWSSTDSKLSAVYPFLSGGYVSNISNYETWLGTTADFVLGYATVGSADTSWTNLQNNILAQLAAIAPSNKRVHWSFGPPSGVTLAQIAAGTYDAQLLAVARLIAQGRPTDPYIFFRPLWEANSPTYAWTAVGVEATYIAAFRRIVELFMSVDPRFRIVWGINYTTRYGGVAYDPSQYYPGDRYVDIIDQDVYYLSAIDGTDPVAAFRLKVADTYGLNWVKNFALTHGKPFGIGEWGVDSDTASAYVSLMLEWFIENNVIYFGYFNADNSFAHNRLDQDQYPTVSARFKSEFSNIAKTNLFASPNTFTAGVWGKTAVQSPVGGQTDPFGGSTAWNVLETAVTQQHFLQQTYTKDTAVRVYRVWVRVKPIGHNFARIQLQQGSFASGESVFYDLVNGVIDSFFPYGSLTNPIPFAVPDINGFVKIGFEFTAIAATDMVATFGLATGDGTDNYLGDVTMGGVVHQAWLRAVA
jgi:hypothetical protein